jgi:hypothetical protein
MYLKMAQILFGLEFFKQMLKNNQNNQDNNNGIIIEKGLSINLPKDEEIIVPTQIKLSNEPHIEIEQEEKLSTPVLKTPLKMASNKKHRK